MRVTITAQQGRSQGFRSTEVKNQIPQNTKKSLQDLKQSYNLIHLHSIFYFFLYFFVKIQNLNIPFNLIKLYIVSTQLY